MSQHFYEKQKFNINIIKYYTSSLLWTYIFSTHIIKKINIFLFIFYHMIYHKIHVIYYSLLIKYVSMMHSLKN